MIVALKIRLSLTCIFICMLASCTTTTVDEFRQGETGIESDESVVILGRRQASDFETKSDFYCPYFTTNFAILSQLI